MVVVPAVTFGGGVGVEVTRGLEGEALRLASTKGDLTRVQFLLLQEGASVNLTDEFGYTALQRAASEGHLDVVRLLIKHKAIIDHQDDQHGNTALHEAAWKGYSQTAEALVRAKANVYIKNKGGFAPLHLACQNSHNQTCRILLLAGCKPDIKNNYGDTPLHTAARYGHAGVSRILISGKANVNEVNKNNDTALHIAVAMNRKKLTKILLESATDQAIRNKQHETPEEICLRKGFDQILETLRNPPPVVPHEERVQQEHEQKRKETKEVTFKDFIDEGKGGGGGGKGEKKSDKKREKTNGSGTSSKDSSTRTKDKKKHKYEHKEKHRGRQVSWSPYGCQYYPPMPAQDLPDTPNLDSLPKDPLDTGEQYYIDLAGNIRKGPLGVGNSCHCTPFIKDAKTKLEKDKFALVDHIDCANGKLDAKISDLEQRAVSHIQHIRHNVKQIAKGKEDRKKRGEIPSSGHKPQEILQRSEQLRQWAEHQLAASSSFQYMYNPKPYVAGPPSRSRDPMCGFLPLTRSWSEEAVSEYRDDIESGRFSSYKGLKVLDHPTSMYNITKCLNDEPDEMSEYRRPIPSLIPGSYRCPSPDGCQSRITDKSWRLTTPLSRRRESRCNSVDFSDHLDEPYGPFKFDSSVKLLALFPPKKDLVKDSTDSGASTSERESGGNRSMNTSSNRGSTVAGNKKPWLGVHFSKNNKLVKDVPGNVPVYSPGLKTGTGKVRVETGAIPKGTTPHDLPPAEADASKYKVPQRDKAYSPCELRSTSTMVRGGQPTLVSNLSEYNYSKINDEMNQRYNITPERRQPERIYESYSRPPAGGGKLNLEMETDLDLDRRRMQQAAQRLYNGYFAKGHLEPMRRTGRPPLSPFKERDSQNDSGYSARVSSSSSQEPSPTFSG